MEKYIDILKSTKLFANVDKDDINSMLKCMNARLLTYKKGEYIFRQGDII